MVGLLYLYKHIMEQFENLKQCTWLYNEFLAHIFSVFLFKADEKRWFIRSPDCPNL